MWLNETDFPPLVEYADCALANEDLVAVLRTQMEIESDIETLLLKVIPGSEKLMIEMGFWNKIRAAKSYELIGKDELTALEGIATLRNHFAHRKDRVLTIEDDKAIVKSIKGPIKSIYDEMTILVEGMFEERVGKRARLAMVAVHARLQNLASGKASLTDKAVSKT